MTPWFHAAFVLLLALIPCGIVVFRGDPVTRLVGLEMTGMVVTLFMVVFCEAINRPPFLDLALALSLLAFAGGLVFARFLERWL